MDPEVGGSNPPNCTTLFPSISDPQNFVPKSLHSGAIWRMFDLCPFADASPKAFLPAGEQEDMCRSLLEGIQLEEN